MQTNRFILENLLLNRAGLPVLPPYKPGTVAQPNNGQAYQYGEIAAMSDQQLQQAIVANANGIPMFMPLSIKLASEPDSSYWTFPCEPIISLNGKNVVVRRSVAKSEKRGTVKERWSHDDYTISIQGVIINYKNEKVYPREEVNRLRMYMEAREAISVKCELLEIFGINQMAIETFDIPFTKGEYVQGYSITAYSDDAPQLLIKLDNYV
ncbi:hypothetical protein KTO58_19745 [Chitinophaga pendula]|uniref:DUF6046 domain-containing protein n=1 Tax=Chitinophaga TaxID=79328 RepID=UPI000BB079B8|nr:MULTISPECIES: DUF6046 domain-containing protein [Chitinophaga]ASZ11098.1 hypothetical protein CK934_09055 [Chitinophaga sp. MD30]UCJ05904.1 hypothetical protein KTO58_19745 [Chitinophaga pendula]